MVMSYKNEVVKIVLKASCLTKDKSKVPAYCHINSPESNRLCQVSERQSSHCFPRLQNVTSQAIIILSLLKRLQFM